jgi:hypothetical protein
MVFVELTTCRGARDQRRRELFNGLLIARITPDMANAGSLVYLFGQEGGLAVEEPYDSVLQRLDAAVGVARAGAVTGDRGGAGDGVLAVQPRLDHCLALVRHICGHSARHAVADDAAAVRMARRPCERCAPPADGGSQDAP